MGFFRRCRDRGRGRDPGFFAAGFFAAGFFGVFVRAIPLPFPGLTTMRVILRFLFE
jgi:hypothetical protein